MGKIPTLSYDGTFTLLKLINSLPLNYANIHAISPMTYIFIYTMDIFRTKTDIAWIFLEHECISVDKRHVL